MTDRLIVEFVCTGNNGRSPMAEAIALDYVHRRGLEDRIEVCSSASGLAVNDAPGWSFAGFEQNLTILKFAARNSIYPESWRAREAQEIIDSANEEMEQGGLLLMDSERSVRFKGLCDNLETYVQYAVNMEAHFRNVALMQVGLFAGGKYHKPTQARHSGLILPMAESNAGQVRKIYEGSSFVPKVEHLNAYASVEGDVPNPFCRLLPAYQASRDHLMKVVPMSMEKAVAEYL